MTVEVKEIEIRLELNPIKDISSTEHGNDTELGERCTVRFVGRVQKEDGLLGIHYDLSHQYLYDSLSCHLGKDVFCKLSILHRVGFVSVGQVTTVITLSTRNNHSMALDLLKKIIDHMKHSIVHKKLIQYSPVL